MTVLVTRFASPTLAMKVISLSDKSPMSKLCGLAFIAFLLIRIPTFLKKGDFLINPLDSPFAKGEVNTYVAVSHGRLIS